MTTDQDNRNRHFLLKGVTQTEPFRSGGMARRPDVPERGRKQHSTALRGQLAEVQTSAESAAAAQRDSGMSEGFGIQVEFESFPGIDLAFESLARENSGIELLNVRHGLSDSGTAITKATVFVPDGKLSHFEGLIRDYMDHKVDAIGRSRDNRRLIDAINRIRAATLRALWTDDTDFPSEDEGLLWWEVWLPAGKRRQETVSSFRVKVNSIGAGIPDSLESSNMMDAPIGDTTMRVAEGHVYFPERTVVLVHASVGQLQQSLPILNSIAELRRARDTAEFFDSFTTR